jgi:hypothetical protein
MTHVLHVLIFIKIQVGAIVGLHKETCNYVLIIMKFKMDLSLEQNGVIKAHSIIFPTLSIIWIHFTMP